MKEKYDITNSSTFIIKLVFCRAFTLLVFLLSIILLSFANVVRPWKFERVSYEYWSFEISPWTVCSVRFFREKCFTEDYNNAIGNVAVWVYVWRWSMMLSIGLLFIAWLYLCIQLVRLQNKSPKPWMVVALLALVLGIFNLIMFGVFYAYRKFEFLDEIRMERMGWTSFIRSKSYWTEEFGLPVALWIGSSVTMIITSACAFYTHFVENTYIGSLW